MDNEGLQEATKVRRPMTVTFVVGVTLAVLLGVAIGSIASMFIILQSARLIP